MVCVMVDSIVFMMVIIMVTMTAMSNMVIVMNTVTR